MLIYFDMSDGGSRAEPQIGREPKIGFYGLSNPRNTRQPHSRQYLVVLILADPNVPIMIPTFKRCVQYQRQSARYLKYCRSTCCATVGAFVDISPGVDVVILHEKTRSLRQNQAGYAEPLVNQPVANCLVPLLDPEVSSPHGFM